VNATKSSETIDLCITRYIDQALCDVAFTYLYGSLSQLLNNNLLECSIFMHIY